jgi:hypothetical protein
MGGRSGNGMARPQLWSDLAAEQLASIEHSAAPRHPDRGRSCSRPPVHVNEEERNPSLTSVEFEIQIGYRRFDRAIGNRSVASLMQGWTSVCRDQGWMPEVRAALCEVGKVHRHQERRLAARAVDRSSLMHGDHLRAERYAGPSSHNVRLLLLPY